MHEPVRVSYSRKRAHERLSPAQPQVTVLEGALAPQKTVSQWPAFNQRHSFLYFSQHLVKVKQHMSDREYSPRKQATHGIRAGPPSSHSDATTLLPVIQRMLCEQSPKHTSPYLPMAQKSLLTKERRISSSPDARFLSKTCIYFSFLCLCQELSRIFDISVSFQLSKNILVDLLGRKWLRHHRMSTKVT